MSNFQRKGFNQQHLFILYIVGREVSEYNPASVPRNSIFLSAIGIIIDIETVRCRVQPLLTYEAMFINNFCILFENEILDVFQLKNQNRERFTFLKRVKLLDFDMMRDEHFPHQLLVIV